ncbi:MULTISPECIES: Na+/H+ antiporter subunit G [Halomonas]|uniref:Na+/H+ antiporter subunit G n=3 Tax=Halomonas TaxID=2745 RepID=A0AAU7KKX4_9GAMM|nr:MULTISPECIES: Na+/H+ antiporter subunit G [Halomonas]MBR9878254.1 Na+/H+ antiporter subunit G [Gammaproteobacteria bacterium]KJZ16735.1 sodium:proton antiporter [Halomonas sp. S2151]MAR73808.1 Na+/H+ antiporter subunit G [Halomonas sp.]MAY72365.1 Na+/H+ antiporter subunit G [Halomonas sp.]MBS8268305.1 Na+/H+ antiporter subunit G [Halomonas litopenaei]|tara:strand:- start:220 stop:603 length:384 start_codon:yes stop_codon:yes gene_type:complete
MFYVILEGLISVLLIAGGLFAFIGSLGMAHLRDFYMRLHGPTKATTLGMGCILSGSMVYFSATQEGTHLQEMLITLFLFITAPVSAHMLAKTGLHQRLKYLDKTRGKPLEFREEEVGDKPVPHPDRD